MKLAIIASGGGTTFEAIAKHIRSGSLDFQDPVLLTTRKQCGAIKRAEKLKIPHRFWPKNVPLHHMVDPTEYSIICLAGCLRILSPEEVRAYQTILNSHPGPLPEFGGMGMHGLHVHAAVLKYLELTRQDPGHTCATIHLVNSGVDTGPVIREFWLHTILGAVDPEDLAEELLPFEHRIYLDALADLAANRLRPLAPSRGRRIYLGEFRALQSAKEYGKEYGRKQRDMARVN